jgi:Tol biopolymer transport system component
MRARTFAWRRALPMVAIACVCGWLAPAAAAEFGPIQLISKSSREQANFATEPALSEDGGFVAFVGELGGHAGIFEKDLVTGALSLVVESSGGERGPTAPSISADGRYVAFTITGSPVAGSEPEGESESGEKEVYVADLATAPPTYRLASAADGSEAPLPGGSTATGRVALSADGGRVAFVNGGNVYVRELATERTVPISTVRVPLTGMTEEAVPGGGADAAAGAALSADGSTVAWVGEHLPAQVPLLRDEEEKIKAFDEGSLHYREPLWRRVPTAGDPTPPTRRIVGGGDPLAPGCPAGGSLSEPACQGPFPGLINGHEGVIEESIGPGWGLDLPQLSADGDTVALVGLPEEFDDLFVVDMAPGLSRDEAVHRLTKWTNPSPAAVTVSQIQGFPAYVGAIESSAISPDGNFVAFTTQRQHISGSSILVSPLQAAFPEITEMYQADLQRGTIERLTPGPDTGVSLAAVGGSGAGSPSYSADGRFLAFSDTAYNLVAGDANEANDVFLVESTPPGPVEPSRISPPPSRLSVVPSRRLTAHAVSRPNGAVRVIATVPGAGVLRASAKSPLGPRLRSRVVTTAQRRSRSGGELRLELKLPRRLRDLAHRKGGLYAWLELRFSGPSGTPLQQQFAARFRAHRPKAAKKGKAK